MTYKKMKKQIILAWFSLIGLLVILTTATYAWFTFNRATNIEPMSSTISDGDANLLIANKSSGPFDKECTLIFDTEPDRISPVSTADLEKYFLSSAQDANGISLLYNDVTTKMGDYVLTGKVYLESTGGTNNVYFNPEQLDFGSNTATLLALRCGMRITVGNNSSTYIFKLDGLANGSAGGKLTVPKANTVVESVGGKGEPSYKTDPSENITDYTAVMSDESPQPGKKLLCTIATEQVATVEYWVYLEGCDENCSDDVQSRDIPLKLAFAGVPEVNN